MDAPGWPGIPARWTSSAKSGVGTAVTRDSRVWFTLSHGILNEVYYPRVDQACIRDLGLIVTDGQTFFSEEKRDARSETLQVAPGVPAYRIRNVQINSRYRIEKEVLTDPWRDVVLQRIRFVPLQGALGDFRLYVLLAPHLANCGSGNTAWVGEYKGRPMLLATRENCALALACSAPWLARSVGFVGFSDGWQELRANKRLIQTYMRAENGNVAVTGEVDLRASNGLFVLALGFGPTAMEAGEHALISLMEDFDATTREYVRGWKAWHTSLHTGASPKARRRLYRLSAAVLRTHESKHEEGGVIASLSIPWGFSKGDNDLGGYHLVWPRDLVETAGGFVAVGAHHDARRVLRYLQATQEPDGHWSQNMWLDGTPYWQGIQMGETADAWNASVERWLYVAGTELAQRHGVDGYYVRVAEPDRADAASPSEGFVPIKNRPPDQTTGPAALMVSPDALALVRFGLRSPDDPRIVGTVKVVDATLKVETPHGPAWYRYQGDAYGEHADGAPFDGTGNGRLWPLLTGERAHYELAAGRKRAAEQLARALESFAGASGLLPEQIWDAADIPERELFFGQASGSARPLVWAHAEYLKLCRSLRDGQIFDRPPQTVQRYLVKKVKSDHVIWRFNNKVRTMASGKILRIETLARARVHWSADGWRTVRDTDTRDTTLGVHVVDLPTASLPSRSRIDFTFYWLDRDPWEGSDSVVIDE